jgi:ABC-2 type transport system ATP-binding protein
VLLGLRDPEIAALRALTTVELDTVADRAVGGFSKGMRQRTKLAAALVHEPTLLLLDEPFNGLDPRQRLHMMRLLEDRASEGTAVLLSSHILEEIEGVASRILVMLSGRLAASGDHRTLRRMMTDRPHTVRIRSTNDRALASALLSSPTVMGVDVEADALLVRAADYTGFAHQVGTVAQQASITLLEVQPTDESLEHVFAYLVAR